MDKIKHTFISHYHEDEENIEKMRSLLGDSYTIKNSSVTSDKFNRAKDPDYIKQMLRERIQWAGKFICLIGPHTHESEWVDYEIREAHKMGKEIIGVYIWGATDADVPEALSEYADALVGWNRESIEKALAGDSTFSNADGTPRRAGYVERGTC